MSRIFKIAASVAIFVSMLTLMCGTKIFAQQNACAIGGSACEPYVPGGKCNIGDSMKLRLVIDVSKNNKDNLLYNRWIFVNNSNVTQNQVGWGFCPQVDQLQAFQMINSSAWAAGDIAGSTWSTNDTQAKYLRIFGAVGLHDDDLVPPSDYDSAAVVYDPSAPACKDEYGASGQLVASFLVINFTMSNGAYRLTPGFSQSVQVGFMSTCDSNDLCLVDASSPCIGPAGRRNCAQCITGFSQLLRTPVQVFASYYGTDSRGRRMQSGAANPLNFRALASTGVFDAVKRGLQNAVGKVTSVGNQITGGGGNPAPAPPAPQPAAPSSSTTPQPTTTAAQQQTTAAGPTPTPSA